MNRILRTIVERVIRRVVRFLSNMFSNDKNLETILKNCRSNATTTFEEQHLIREFLQIIYNRQNFGSNKCQINFAIVFLRQSGLQFDDRLAFEEYESYRKRKVLKYRPHIKIAIKSIHIITEDLKRVWPDFHLNDDKVLELTIITSIDENRKQRKKFKYNDSALKSGVSLQIDCEFIHPLSERSEDIWISLSFGRHHHKYHKYFYSFCQTNKVLSKGVSLNNLRGMPLTGYHNRCPAIFSAINSSESLLQTEVEVRVEFTDEPKHNIKFKTEKMNSHKNLLAKIYNRWITDAIPSQMKAIIEMNRQQNGITSDESYVLEEYVLSEIQQLSEVNKKRKEFFSLINRAPTPQSNDFDDDDHNNNSGFVPPVRDNNVFKLLNNKIKIKEYSQ